MVINSPPMLVRLAHHEQTIYCWGYSACYDLTVILDIPRMDGTDILTMIWEVPMMGGDINLMMIYGKYP